MDITGKIIEVREPREGVSNRTGNKWKSQDYIIEWFEGQYPRHCIFTVFGEDRISQMNLQQGQEYTVSLDIDAHEYNGRWFNDIRAWRALPPQQQAEAANPANPQDFQPTPPAPAPTDVPAPEAEETADDLPF